MRHSAKSKYTQPSHQLPVASVGAQEEHQVSWHQAGTDFAVSEEYQVLQAVLRELSALWLEDAIHTS